MQVSFHIRSLDVRVRGKTLLSVNDLAIPHGCHTAIVGPNGAGKSTLLKALIGQAGRGRVTLFGRAVPPQLKQGRVAWVGQHGRYQMPLTVREYITLGRQNRRYLPFQTAPESDPQADALLADFDLAHLAGKRIQNLSGGEQQRANIIRALLQNAPVLLLDEPCNHLDIRHRHRLMQYLNRHRQHFSAIMVLHDLNLAVRYAQYAVLLDRGGVVAAGCTEEVMQPGLLSGIYRWPIRRICSGGQIYFGSR